jgi:(p)ppGpp synthase/HD superfamily hydrolase
MPNQTNGRLAAAMSYAALIHGTQKRKGTAIPYISHLMSVSALVMEFGGDEDQAVAGLLHDALEDCGPEHEKVIHANWGSRVAKIVQGCTDGIPDANGKKADWHSRKRKYLEHLLSVENDTLLVSACDKLHNARAIVSDLRAGHDVFARFNAGRDGTLWYYQSLAETISSRFGKTTPIARELISAVAYMNELAEST